MEEVWLAKAILEKAQSFNDAGPTPAAVTRGEDFYFEDVAGLGAFDKDGAGEGVDAGAVDGEEFGGGHAGAHLATARVHALNLHFVAGVDAEAGLERAVPHGVGWFGGKSMFHHDSFTRTVI